MSSAPTTSRTLASDLRRLRRSALRPFRGRGAGAAQAVRGRARTTSTARRVLLVALASLLPVVVLSVVLAGALSRTADVTSTLRDEVSTSITPVLTATDELGEAAVLLDRFFASGAEHDRAAFAAHARRVDAAFAPLREDGADLADAGHLVDGAWSSWTFVRDTVTPTEFAVPTDPQARTGLLATLSTALNDVRSDLRGLSEAAARDVAELAADAERTANGMRVALGVGLALASVLGLVTLTWLVRDLRRGIGALVEGAERMQHGALEHRVPEDLPGDLAPVAEAFNAMAARIEQQRGELHGLASNDGLTGLLNRRTFQEELEAEFERSTRYGHRTAVLLLDVDHFKRVNDTLGHPAGDAVLQAVAEQITAAVRGVDSVGRWGGEEFAILLPETEETAARRVAERVVQLVGERVVLINGQRVSVTVSVGVAVHDPLDRAIGSAEELVGLADAALYEAKESGRNRACFATIPA